jgi:hypothetical protein
MNARGSDTGPADAQRDIGTLSRTA